MKNLFSFFILLCLSPSIAFAYLDPGSGSLLLSSIVALFASALFFIKNLFYKIISFGTYNPLTSATSTTGGGQSHKNLVFYAEGPQYYGTFKPILDALDSLKHPYTYYTSSQNDPALKRLDSNNRLDSSRGLESSPSKNGEFIYIGEGNKAYNLLNRLRADILVLTTPGLDVLHIKRNRGVAHYCHIVHSLSPMTYRVFGVDYFDSVLVANGVQEDFIRDIESAHNVKRKHIAITGSTYLDELSLQANALESTTNCHTEPSEVSNIESKKDISCLHTRTSEALVAACKYDKKLESTNSTKTILVSPSWGKETLLNKYGLDLLLPLVKSPYHIIIRPHPQSYISPSEKANIQHLQEALKDYSNVEWDKDTPNIYAFARADMMISDFSSVIFDFVCLQGKPALTIDNDMDLSGYDMADIERDSIWTFKALDRIGKRISQKHFSQIQEICEEIFNSCDLKDTQQSGLNTNTAHTHNSHKNTQLHLQETKELLWQHPHNAGMQSARELLKIEREIVETRLKPQIALVARLRELDTMLEKGLEKGKLC